MEIQITKDNGEIVSRSYLERRVSSHLSKLRRIYSVAERQAVMAKTVKDDAWLKRRNCQTVGSICRDVERQL